MSDTDATPYPFDTEPKRAVSDADIKAMEAKIAAYESKRRGLQLVAHVAEVHMSRYTIEWAGPPLAEGTPLYAYVPLEGRSDYREKLTPEGRAVVDSLEREP